MLCSCKKNHLFIYEKTYSVSFLIEKKKAKNFLILTNFDTSEDHIFILEKNELLEDIFFNQEKKNIFVRLFMNGGKTFYVNLPFDFTFRKLSDLLIKNHGRTWYFGTKKGKTFDYSKKIIEEKKTIIVFIKIIVYSKGFYVPCLTTIKQIKSLEIFKEVKFIYKDNHVLANSCSIANQKFS